MPDSSTDLVRVYTTALERNEPPRLSVARYFKITVTAAAGRIYRARKKGLLAPWKRRTTPTVVDEHTITGTVVRPARRVASMDSTERAALRKAFDDGRACPQCGGLHTRACPRVKRIVYNAAGGVSEVEFFPPGTWSDDAIIWPEDIEDDGDAEEDA